MKPASVSGPRSVTPPLTVEIAGSSAHVCLVRETAPETEPQSAEAAAPSASLVPEVEEIFSVPARTPASAVLPETFPASSRSVPSSPSPRIVPEVEFSARAARR